MVSMPNIVTHLNRTPEFEWCMVKHGSKNGHHKDNCLIKMIGLCA